MNGNPVKAVLISIKVTLVWWDDVSVTLNAMVLCKPRCIISLIYKLSTELRFEIRFLSLSCTMHWLLRNLSQSRVYFQEKLLWKFILNVKSPETSKWKQFFPLLSTTISTQASLSAGIFCNKCFWLIHVNAIKFNKFSFCAILKQFYDPAFDSCCFR